MVAVPNIKLSSGHDMPQVGFGLWKVDNAVAADTVYEAIKAGYRLFDGAAGESTVYRTFLLFRPALSLCPPRVQCGNNLAVSVQPTCSRR
jgi:hypothetical protein